jgi:hypothetical protein
VDRLRKTVTRAAASLPSLILWALGPKEPAGMAVVLLAIGVGGLALAGLAGVLRLRTWGVLALGGAAAALLATGNVRFLTWPCGGIGDPTLAGEVYRDTVQMVSPMIGGLVAGVFLLAAVLPFVGPAVRFLRRP